MLSLILFITPYRNETKFARKEDYKLSATFGQGYCAAKPCTVLLPSGSGVLDNILLSTKRDHAQITPEPGELSMDEGLLVNGEPETSNARAIHGEKRRRESPHSHGVRSSEATADFAPKTVNSTDLNSVNQKIDLLMTMMNDIAPVVKTLNKAYEDSLFTESDEDIDDSGATDTTGPEISMGVVDSLVSEINTDEKTGAAISEKIARALDGILSVGLIESVAAKRKEAIDRPQNCKLLATTRVNPEIWDIAKKQTRSMDARFQQLQGTLMKGLIPLASIAGKVGEAIDTGSSLPSKEQMWEALSHSSVLVALANHDLNICCRDMFKADLNEDYKALCNNKHPVGELLFGDDLGERLKTITETNKAAKQLTGNNLGQNSRSNPKPFFSHEGQDVRPRKNSRKFFPRDRRQNKGPYLKAKRDAKATKQRNT